MYCKYCENEKIETEFNKSKSTKTGYQYRCRDCERQYRQNNKEKISVRMKKYRENNSEQEKVVKKEYYINNKEKITKKNKEWRILNDNKIKIQKQQYYINNKERVAKYHKNYRLNNLEKYRKYQREYTKHKRDTDPHYKLEHRLRNRLLCGLKKNGNKKLDRFWNLTGCTKKELKIHIESQFIEGMTWSKFNSGEIVIDHIKPCCSFDLSKLEQQKECFHYTNLRPLWKTDNQQKISGDLKQSIKSQRNMEFL